MRPTFGQNMIVFMVSAFWHGFYPFYYVTFVLAMISTEIAKDLFKAKKYLFYGLIIKTRCTLQELFNSSRTAKTSIFKGSSAVRFRWKI